MLKCKIGTTENKMFLLFIAYYWLTNNSRLNIYWSNGDVANVRGWLSTILFNLMNADWVFDELNYFLKV